MSVVKILCYFQTRKLGCTKQGGASLGPARRRVGGAQHAGVGVAVNPALTHQYVPSVFQISP